MKWNKNTYKCLIEQYFTNVALDSSFVILCRLCCKNPYEMSTNVKLKITSEWMLVKYYI